MLHIPSSADTDFKDNGAAAVPAGGKVRGGLISGIIVKENMRRFWPIGLVALLVNIAAGVLPMVIEYNNNMYDSGVLDSTLTGVTAIDGTIIIYPSVIIFGIIGMIFAVISAVAVFRYLHSPSSLAVIHTFPVKKASLYSSNLLSGLILALAPFIPCMVFICVYFGKLVPAYTGMSQWALEVCVIILFTYAVSVLAGMVSGNSPVHTIAALVFNFAWIFLYFMAVEQLKAGLYGLDFSNKSLPTSYLHPFAYFTNHNGNVADYSMGPIYRFSMEFAGPTLSLILGIVIYFLISVALFAISYFLYRAFKAERVGESITFRPVEYIFIYIAALGGMFLGESMLGSFDIAKWDMPDIDPMTYVSPYDILGAVMGAVVAFVVALMIVKKSARVFNFAALRRFGVFAVAAVIFMVCTLTNITGIETRVPETAEVKSGALLVSSNVLPPYKSGFYEGIYEIYIPIHGENDMQTLADFHENALDEKAYMVDTLTDETVETVEAVDENYDWASEIQTAQLAYGLKNGSKEFRTYRLSGKYLTGSDLYAKLMSSESVKNYFSIKNLIGYENFNIPEIYYRNYDGDEEQAAPDTDVRSKLTDSALAEFAACLDADYMAMSADDMMNPGKELFTLRIWSKRPAGNYYEDYDSALSGKGRSIYKQIKKYDESFGMKYTVTEKSVKTVAWLKDMGIYDSIVKSAENLKAKHDATYNSTPHEYE